MRQSIGIAVIIVLGSFFISACNSSSLEGDLSWLSKDGSDLVQSRSLTDSTASQLLRGTPDYKQVGIQGIGDSEFEYALLNEKPPLPTWTPTPTHTPDPEGPYVYTGQVEFIGRVTEMGRLIWLIGDQRVLVTQRTDIEGDIKVGDLVKVHGVRWIRGVIIARHIELLERIPPHEEVEFRGRVELMGKFIWVIGDQRVMINKQTVIEGDISVGDLVKVRGFRLPWDLIVASEIKLLEKPPGDQDVEFTGRVKEMRERIWLIGDRRVRVNERTEIEGDIDISDLVKVRGLVGEEGAVIALKITLLEKDEPPVKEIQIRGRVQEIGEQIWIIARQRVLITDKTEINGDISVGDLVSVRGYLSDEGEIVAEEILLLELSPDRDRDFSDGEEREGGK